MKIVHSFWTKPYLSKGFNKFQGGWAEKKYYYLSWALSCLQFRAFYDSVELVTDAYGKYLLIDLMQLPYTSVRVELDSINHYHPDLWALGKTVAYSLQEEPFIHADGDVYIYKRLPDSLEHAALIAQHEEVDFPYYRPHYEAMAAAFDYISPCMLADREDDGIFRSYCAGLLGGQNHGFFKQYREEVFALLDRNQQHLEKLQVTNLNVIFDQYLFYCLARQENIPVSTFAQNVEMGFEAFTDFTGIPHRQTYVHPVDLFKKYKTKCELLAFRLRRDHPEYYYRTVHLLDVFAI